MEVTITANPPPDGTFFAGWMGDVGHAVDPKAQATKIKMPAKSISVAATYGNSIPCRLGVKIIPEGSGSVNISVPTIFFRQPVMISAAPTPGTGNIFARWEIADPAAVEIPHPFAVTTQATLSADATVRAIFAEEQEVTHALISLDNSQPRLDSVSLAADLPTPDLLSFDAEAAQVKVLVDGFKLELSRSCGVYKKISEDVWRYTSNPGTTPKIKFVFDLDAGQWSLSASNLDGVSRMIDQSDELGVFLMIAGGEDADSRPRIFGGRKSKRPPRYGNSRRGPSPRRCLWREG